MIEAAFRFFAFDLAECKDAELAIIERSDGRTLVAVEVDGRQVSLWRYAARFVPDHGWCFVRECHA